MKKTLAGATLIFLGTVSVALAGGPPIALTYGSTTGIQLLGPTDYQDVTLAAQAGVDTWFGLTNLGAPGSLTLYDPNGSLVASVQSEDTNDGATERGFEFRPTVTGQYRAVVTGPSDPSYYPGEVGVRWEPDCRGGAQTRCTIVPGKTKQADWGGGNDNDAYVIKAAPGRRYVATLTDIGGQGPVLEVVDAKGLIFKSQRVRGGSADQRFFLPRTGGPYRLVAVGEDFVNHSQGGAYTLTLRPD